MNCAKCGGKLEVTHSYAVEAGKTQRAVCKACDTEYVATWVLAEVREADHGAGAAALAKQVRRGDAWLEGRVVRGPG